MSSALIGDCRCPSCKRALRHIPTPVHTRYLFRVWRPCSMCDGHGYWEELGAVVRCTPCRGGGQVLDRIPFSARLRGGIR